MALESLIKNKKFDWTNPDITEENFPLQEIRGTEYKLYHFNKRILSEDAIKEIQRDGYEPSNLYELLEWKDWNNKDYVVALGSVGEVHGDRRVPGLCEDSSGRVLGLGWWGSDWNSHFRFLAVRPLSSDTLNPQTLGNLDSLSLEKAIQLCKDNGMVVYKVM
jgi:hypothetical protein